MVDSNISFKDPAFPAGFRLTACPGTPAGTNKKAGQHENTCPVASMSSRSSRDELAGTRHFMSAFATATRLT